MKLEPWQHRFWAEALDGWRSVVLVVARKNGKTSMLAGFGLYELVYGVGRPEILFAAASDRQAGRLFDAAARFVRRHEGLSQLLRVRGHEGVLVREDGLGSIVRLTSDPSRLFGYSPTAGLRRVGVLDDAEPSPRVCGARIGRRCSQCAADVYDHDRR